jgi:hypothetical protein
MKKLIGLFLIIFSLFCFTQCDPIEDATGDTKFLIFKGENGKDGVNGIDGINGQDGINGISCIATRISNGVEITCGNISTIIYDGTDGVDGSDGTCIDCCPVITVLPAPCSTRFVVLKITIGTSTKYVSTEPVHKGNTIYDVLVTELEIGQGYKYESVSTAGILDYCFFKINSLGNALIAWDGIE